MKIHESQGSLIQQAGKKQGKNSVDGSDFKKIMDKAGSDGLEKGAASSEIGNHRMIPVGGVQILNNVEQVNGESSSEKDQVLKTIKETLDFMDFYATKLSDSRNSDTSMEPLINHLEDRMEVLKGATTSQGVPEELTSVIADMLVTISTEIAKFRRGDYS